MKTTKIFLYAMFAVLLLSAFQCEKEKNQPNTQTPVEEQKEPEQPEPDSCAKKYEEYKCEYLDNLLADPDLLWLKNIVEGLKQPDPVRDARIYLCNYRDGVGFLIEWCDDCPDGQSSFRSYEGDSLCYVGGLLGDSTCTEFNVDFENKELIFKITWSIICQ